MSKKMFQYEDSFGNLDGYHEDTICGFKVTVNIADRVEDKDFQEIDAHTEAIEAIVKKYAKKLGASKESKEE